MANCFSVLICCFFLLVFFFGFLQSGEVVGKSGWVKKTEGVYLCIHCHRRHYYYYHHHYHHHLRVEVVEITEKTVGGVDTSFFVVSRCPPIKREYWRGSDEKRFGKKGELSLKNWLRFAAAATFYSTKSVIARSDIVAMSYRADELPC